MNIKRIFLILIGLFVCALLIFGWVQYNEGGPVPYPISIGDFFTIGSTTIDPATLLDDVENGKEVINLDPQSNIPNSPAFIMTVGWSQNDYLEIAKAFHKAIWKDDPNEWHLYRAFFYLACKNSSAKFEGATLYYYQEVEEDEKSMYSVRAISIEPQYGYIAWGGDTFYPRPMIGEWREIDLEKITKVPAEEALKLAEQQGGKDIRKSVDDSCWIHVNMWPWGYKSSDWSVIYGGNSEITDGRIWISSK